MKKRLKMFFTKLGKAYVVLFKKEYILINRNPNGIDVLNLCDNVVAQEMLVRTLWACQTMKECDNAVDEVKELLK